MAVTSLTISLFAMAVLWQAHQLLTSPTCGFCGKKREHARDCPQKKHD